MLARNIYTGEAFAPALNVWYPWTDSPPPYAAKEVECRRGLTGPAFAIHLVTVPPRWDVTDIYWRNPQ